MKAKADFYVAVNGSDCNPGTKEKPFKTITRARDAIAELKKDNRLEKGVTVFIREGKYYLSKPVIFSHEDSGTAKTPVTYKAYPGEKPVLSGGRVISNWQSYKGKILQAKVSGFEKINQLFFNGKRQTRARGPNIDPQDTLYGGWAFIEEVTGKTSFRYEKATFKGNLKKPEEGFVNIFPWLCWNNDIIPIKDVDHDCRTITLCRPVIHRLNQAAGVLDFMSLMPGNRFYVENILELLDEPGQWCHERGTNTLYFWPDTDSIDSSQVVVPVLNRLIEFRGSTGLPVSYITVSGLSFTETLSLFPRPEIYPHNCPNSGGFAVFLEGAENCTIEKCLFDSVGGDGIRLQNYNANNRIVRNHISHCGAQGICIAGVEQELPSRPTPHEDKQLFVRLSQERPKSIGNLISNNHIHHTGSIDKRGSGVYVYGINVVDNVISHNLIKDTAHRGIMIVHGFGRNIIEYNELHDLALEAADTGGINTLIWYVIDSDERLCNGNIIRYNLVDNVVGCGAYEKEVVAVGKTKAEGKIRTPYYGWGIYLDWNPVKTTVYGNITIGNALGGIIMLGHARENIIENNIFINSSHSQIYHFSLMENARDNKLIRNIIYYDDKDSLLIHVGKQLDKRVFTEHDYNLYYNKKGKPLAIDLPDTSAEESFKAWQKAGFDNHSITVDPLFVDLPAGDYRLKDDSPASELGFKPIPIKRIGLEIND